MAKRKSDKAIVIPDLSKRPTTTTRGSGFVTLYANVANVEVSKWDIRIRLGQIETASVSELAINEIACVYMSPAHAKAFLKALEVGIDNYDKLIAAESASPSVTKH